MSEHGGLQYLDEFVEEMKAYLQECHDERGEAWLEITQERQRDLLLNFFVSTLTDYEKPAPWVGYAVEAMLGYVRDKHPEMFGEQPE